MTPSTLNHQPFRAPAVVWSIAGTDPTAGAGIQADLKTFQGLGVYGCTVITAVMAQNTHGVAAIEYPSPATIEDQFRSLEHDMPPVAIKLGMLGQRSTVEIVARHLASLNARVVCDPVLRSSSGTALLDDDALPAFKRDLLPHVDILTPNRPESAILAGVEDVEEAAKRLLALGPKSVLIKGGHAEGELSQDYWTDGRVSAWINSPRLSTKNTHGGGCTLSSAIAAAIARGLPILDAIVVARAYVNQGLRLAPHVGKGRGPLAHLGWPDDPQDMPWITDNAESASHRLQFADAGPLGLYPIVDRAAWVDRLTRCGVDMIQIRVKDMTGEALEREITEAVAIAKRTNCRLYVNDHWQLALKLKAYGVHIGQDDLPTTDLVALQAAGVRLGLSTHGYAEIARSLAVLPSYLAIGTLFTSPSKSFAHDPLGLDRFATMRRLVPVPVVAIGGITLERAHDVREAGADGIAVISDVTKATNVEARVKAWLTRLL